MTVFVMVFCIDHAPHRYRMHRLRRAWRRLQSDVRRRGPPRSHALPRARWWAERVRVSEEQVDNPVAHTLMHEHLSFATLCFLSCCPEDVLVGNDAIFFIGPNGRQIKLTLTDLQPHHKAMVVARCQATKPAAATVYPPNDTCVGIAAMPQPPQTADDLA